MTRQDLNDAEWRDPRNWSGGWLGIYGSRRDSRLWVPKRNPLFGFTINTAHPAGKFMLIALLGGGFALAVVLVLFSRP